MSGDQKNKYNPSEIEPKWQAKWETDKVYQPSLATAKKPYYNLHMFPYPSAEGLHVGNVYAFTGADIYGRFKRMQGNDVFQPFGLDGFGIHSENYALKVGSHPMDQAEKSETRFYAQVHSLGSGYDWSHTLETYKPDYYKWTQWGFVQLFKAGLAYREQVPVNFCPSCKTVLADEQVIDGKCERCGTVVEKRDLEQWMFRITEYAEKLLEGLDRIDWTEKVKIAQRNWIGKSEGARVTFRVVDTTIDLSVFTTRPDTLYGATFVVVSPEHPVVEHWLDNPGVRAYLEAVKSKTDADRVENDKEKTGVFSGAYALNPITNQQIPVWIADYVLMSYGTGAIMAVPAHDERDFQFAQKYSLPIIYVVEPKFTTTSGDSAVKPNEEFVHRDAVCAIIRNPKDDTYLCVSWKNFHMNGLVTGGIEEGEDPVAAALREIHEETGYKNVSFVKDPGIIINSLFYHRQKKQNRWARFHYLMFELENDEKDPVGEPEKALMDIVWKSKAELKDFFTVVEGQYILDFITGQQKPFVGEGVLGNSGSWNGLELPADMGKILSDIEATGKGSGYTNYHLRDWLISRQRYWGPPIPMIFCQACADAGKSWFDTDSGINHPKLFKHLDKTVKRMAGWYPEERLPVLLPHIEDYKPIGTGPSPLGNHPEFYETTCPSCGGAAKRETDVSDTFLDSNWYFLRYLATDMADIPFPMNQEMSSHFKEASQEEKEQAVLRKQYLPVAIYTGGAEHSVLHLLYTRFFYKVLRELGYIDPKDGDEPFPRFYAHGLIIKDGSKMSKSKGNVIVPDTYIEKFGADTLRAYLMFLGPFNQGGDFRDSGIEGMNRFIKRVWTMLTSQTISGTTISPSAKSAMNEAIKGVTEDVEGFKYNTAIAKIMTYYNALSKEEAVSKQEAKVLLQLLAPFAPHMTEELWDLLGEKNSIHLSAWPSFDAGAIEQGEVVVAVQVNGKLRATLQLESGKDLSQSEIETLAQQDEHVAKHLEGKDIKKVIYVPGKILNFVVA